MRYFTTLFLALALSTLSLLAQTTAPAAATGKTDLPVTRVVLFTSGVGFFEHNGQVPADASVQFSFKTDQINDILKSLIVMSDGPQVTSVNYASKEPLLRALKGFAIDLSGEPTLADLLKQVRGVEVTVMAPDKITGRIVSLERRQKQVLMQGAPVVLWETFLNLSTDGGLKTVNMDTVQNLTLNNPKLQAELSKALELLSTSRDTEEKPVDIHFAGKAGKTRIGYILEMPVWRTSYRLDLAEKSTLQGWAICENTSDHDWTNVDLSLVSGRPISFTMDLYTPLFVPRQVIVPELYASLRPQTYDEGLERKKAALAEMAAKPGEAPPAPAMAGAAAKGEGRRAARGAVTADALEGGEQQLGLSFNAPARVAAATKVGELFRYHIQNPVNLPRRQSAMLPILNAPIEARKVSIYNQSVLGDHPLNGAFLTNNTDLTLLGGPITVFDENMYAGDAQIDNFSPGQKRLISYAIDLPMTVDPSQKTASALAGGKIVRGVLNLSYIQTYTQTYRIKNAASKLRTLIIEQPFVPERKLIEPEKFLEKTPTVYRFETKVDKGATTDFTVREQQTVMQTLAILDLPVDALVVYARNQDIPEPVRKALEQAIEMKNTLARLEAQLNELNNQKSQIEQGQDRLRKNIETVGRDSQLGQRYLKTLSQQEDQLEALNKQIEELRKQVQEQRSKLQDYLSKLDVG